jgi:Fur family peroxide stress response transcriptional regulator
MEGRVDELEERLRSFEGICREHGLSITPQRVAIYKELISSSEHPSAVTIFNKVREYYANISLDTVNRTLLTFQRIGLAKVVESSGDAKRFDPNLEPHHHFKCIRCGKIVDFKNESYDALEVPPEIYEKFVVTGKKVHLEGVCDTCKTSH